MDVAASGVAVVHAAAIIRHPGVLVHVGVDGGGAGGCGGVGVNMAEFLIKAQSMTHTDPTKDARGCYKRGDIVAVFPDGHTWGRLETLPKFVVVKVPGLNAERAAKYMAEQPDALRRRFRLRVDDVPAGIRNQLRDTGQVTVTWAQLRDFLRDKQTNQDETGKAEP
jgi:hypothetical protein